MKVGKVNLNLNNLNFDGLTTRALGLIIFDFLWGNNLSLEIFLISFLIFLKMNNAIFKGKRMIFLANSPTKIKKLIIKKTRKNR